MVIDLSLVKSHLSIDHSDQDTLITQYADAAEDWVAQYLGRDIPWSTDTASEVYPYAVKQAVMVLVGGMYEMRESSVIGASLEDNPLVMLLLNPYRDDYGV